MHYTEGWADGFRYDMEYWEIWNEADGMLDDSPHKPTWEAQKRSSLISSLWRQNILKDVFPISR